jgi:hypothetical protein
MNLVMCLANHRVIHGDFNAVLHSYVTVGDAGALYYKLMNLVMRQANHGVIHGDFNAVFTLLCYSW